MNRVVNHVVLVVSILLASATDSTAQRGGRGGRRGFGETTGPRVPPTEVKFEDGVASIPDREMFDKLSYQGPDAGRDSYLAGLQFVKFQIEDTTTDNPVVYFMNTKTHRGHPMFMRVANIGRSNGQMRGALTYRPLLNGPTGEPGIYTFDFQPNDAHPFEMIQLCYDQLIDKAPLLRERLGYHPLEGGVARTKQELEKYEAANLPVYFDDDLYKDIGFLPLNAAESYGWLRLMEHGRIPSARDVVLCRTLPNELPTVAGMITDVPQTPLSHVNLRAVQDKVPNAFIQRASSNETIEPLIDKPIYYKVTPRGFEIREATPEELDRHFASRRPAELQIPVRDLEIQTVKPLGEMKFGDSSAFGVKATNMAAMRKFDLPEGSVPDGFAVPFYFYDEFMKQNGLYERARTMLDKASFQKDRDARKDALKDFRKRIEKGTMPDDLEAKLGEAQRQFPEGTSIRCRSSTNNEDLPGFSGAGLYDSYTHKPDEGHLSKSVQQVFASIWNLRAFEAREHYRIDHFATAMGVLLHPNFKEERANGVAVTKDVLYQTNRNNYVNAQVGEDLVTNPETRSVPEEILLGWREWDGSRIMRRSNQLPDDQRVLDERHLKELRDVLDKIHVGFAKLYGFRDDDPRFAMEIEFKITRDDTLSVKQARPWVH